MQKKSHTVVPIREQKVSANRVGSAMSHSAISQMASQVLCDFLHVAAKEHIEHAQEKLYEASETGNFEVISIDLKVFKKSSQVMMNALISSVKKSLIGMSTGPEATRPKAVVISNVDDEFGGLELLDTSEIEGQLAINSCVYRSEIQFKEVLFALNKRFAVVLGVANLKMNDNPLGPKSLMDKYDVQIKKELFSEETQKLLYKSFEATVLLKLGSTYENINKVCVRAGIIPKLPKPKIISSDSAREQGQQGQQSETENAALLAGGNDYQNVPVSEIPAALYAPLVEMAQAYRATAAASAVFDGLTVSGQQMRTHELLGSLTELQKTAAVEGVNTTEALRTQIGMQVQVNGERRPYAEQDETLIDVVAMLFDAILQDRHLPDIVRVMIAQLQIPVLKVVMVDRDFFGRKDHPARRFLNALSRAGLGINDKNEVIKNTVFEKMEALVGRVLLEFDDDVQIFSELLEEFEAFMEQQKYQIEVIEERSKKVSKSSEKLELTKRQAAYEVALRLKGTSIPEFVKTFLDDVWLNVLVLSLLRSDREPEALTHSLNVIERLVSSVQVQDSALGCNEILADLPRLLKDIKMGLENISYDFYEAAPWFKDLETWHHRVLSVKAEVIDESIPVVEEVTLVDTDINICDVSLEDDLLREVEDELSNMPDDRFSKRVNAMEVGDWIEYQQDGGELRAKLSWKSSVTLRCLFVDERGGKAMDISLAELAGGLRNKNIRFVGQEKAPLMERALAGMKKMVSSEEPGFA